MTRFILQSLVWMILITLVNGGCASLREVFDPVNGPKQLTVTLNCKDTRAIVQDGVGRTLGTVDSDGLPLRVAMTARAGDDMKLLATVYYKLTGGKVGTATYSVPVPTNYWSDNRGSGMQRDYNVQLDPWTISYLNYTEVRYDCLTGMRVE